jgi:hypothetical protein
MPILLVDQMAALVLSLADEAFTRPYLGAHQGNAARVATP